MDPLLILALMAVGIGAGVLGTLFGLGGGIIFVPVLTILFGLEPSEAAAASLVGIVATSTTAAYIYISEGKSNIRLGLLLEITTSVGAIVGASIAAYLQEWLLLVIFAAVLIYGAVMMLLRKETIIEDATESSEMTFTYDEGKTYTVQNIKSGLALCTTAGVLSSMTGVGGGTIKVPLMNLHMHVPIKVASATSNYMIGITAFSGAAVYFLNGSLLLDYAAAIAIGALVGSYIGAKISKKIDTSSFRRYLSIVLLAISVVILLEAGGIL